MLWSRLGWGVLAGVLLAACSRPDRKPVVVGSKVGTEQTLLGEIAAQRLERRLGQTVERRPNLTGTLNAHQSLVSGEIDVYPECSGTAYTTVLKLPATDDAGMIRERVKTEYAGRFQLAWLPALGFDNPPVMVVRGADARERRIETLSDAAGDRTGWRLGLEREFESGPDGLGAVMRAYRLRLAAVPKVLDTPARYAALETGDATMIVVRAADARLSSTDVLALRDDKQALPPCEVSLVVREATLAVRPAMRQALEDLSGKLSLDTVRRFNREVEIANRRPADVAAEFLRQAGLQ